MVVLVAVAAGASADEPWSRWRGAAGAGAGGPRRFPVEWTDDDLAWSVPLRGGGHASPVVRDGRIYVAAADETAGLRFVACHALADGRQLWLREIPGPIDRHHRQNSSASGSVAVDDDGAYWLWAAHDGLRVEAFTRDGGDKWHADLGPYAGEHGFAGSAAVCGDLVIVSNDHEGHSFVAALESATGRERWRLARESGKSGYATPLVIDAPTGRQIVLTCPVNGTSAYHQGCPAKGSPLSAWRGGDGCGRGVVRTSRRGFVPACAPVSSQKSRFVPTRA
jgi:hypothetical protein